LQGRREAPFSFGQAGVETEPSFFFLFAHDLVGNRFKLCANAALRVPDHARGKALMITEIAQIDVKPGSEKDFEAAVAKARAAFGRSRGFHGFELHRSIEKPQRYRLMVKWETLENHTVDFRGSENFTEWRGLVGQYFASPPDVEHTNTVVTSAG
jgi:heme-degrading monooxygenase HmoA